MYKVRAFEEHAPIDPESMTRKPIRKCFGDLSLPIVASNKAANRLAIAHFEAERIPPVSLSLLHLAI